MGEASCRGEDWVCGDKERDSRLVRDGAVLSNARYGRFDGKEC